MNAISYGFIKLKMQNLLMSSHVAEKTGWEKAPLVAVMKVNNSVDASFVFSLFKSHGKDDEFALLAANKTSDIWSAEDKVRGVPNPGEKNRRESIATEFAVHSNERVARVGLGWIEANTEDARMERVLNDIIGRAGSEESKKAAEQIFNKFREKIEAVKNAASENEKTALSGLEWIADNMSDGWKTQNMEKITAGCRSEAARKRATGIFAEAETRESERAEGDYLGRVADLLGPRFSFLTGAAYRAEEVLKREGKSPAALIGKGDALLEIAKMLSLEGSLDITLMQLKTGLREAGFKLTKSGKIESIHDPGVRLEKLRDIDTDMGTIEKLSEKDQCFNLVIEKTAASYEEAIRIIREGSMKLENPEKTVEMCEAKLKELDEIRTGYAKPG